jgi:glucose/mannose transport system permease protein
MSAASDSVSAGSARTARIVIYTLLIVLAAVYLLPLYVMLTTSFKSLAEIRGGDMLALPRDPSWAAWTKAWGDACIGVTCEGIKGYFWNSIKMVVPAVAISTVLGALNGYVLTKWRFPGHKIVFGLMLFACFIPSRRFSFPWRGCSVSSALPIRRPASSSSMLCMVSASPPCSSATITKPFRMS